MLLACLLLTLLPCCAWAVCIRALAFREGWAHASTPTVLWLLVDVSVACWLTWAGVDMCDDVTKVRAVVINVYTCWLTAAGVDMWDDFKKV